jgi:DivIVA domain-containing protein
VILFFVLIIVLLIGLTTAAVMGKIGGFLADPASSQSFSGVPDGSLSADALAHIHFDLALRGYRMNQVDDVIDALNARLRELEAEVAARSSGEGEPPAAVEPEAAGTDRVSMDAADTDTQER